MRTRNTMSLRAATALIALASLASTPLAAQAGEATLRFDAPKRAGTVRVFFTDLAGETLSANVPIAAGMTAAQKRTAIQNAIVAAGLPAGWNVAGAANSLTITNNQNLSMVANFNPRNTGELADRAVIPGNRPTTFPGGHGKMDPHAPMGMSLSNGTGGPAIFNAGVIVGGVDYMYSIAGNDPAFGGSSMVDELTLTNLLFSGLTSLSLPSGLTLSNTGSDGIDVNFDPSIWSQGDYGIVWGTDSITGNLADDSGFRGTVTAVPTPGAIALGATAMLMAIRRRRAG